MKPVCERREYFLGGNISWCGVFPGWEYFLGVSISWAGIFPWREYFLGGNISWAGVFPGRGVNLGRGRIWSVWGYSFRTSPRYHLINNSFLIPNRIWSNLSRWPGKYCFFLISLFRLFESQQYSMSLNSHHQNLRVVSVEIWWWGEPGKWRNLGVGWIWVVATPEPGWWVRLRTEKTYRPAQSPISLILPTSHPRSPVS